MSSRAAARACWHAQSRGTGPAGPPALAAVVAVSVVRRSGGRIKPCAAPPIRWCRHYDPPPPPGSRVVRPPRRGRHPSRIRTTTTMTLMTAAVASGNMDGGTTLSSLSSPSSSLMTTAMTVTNVSSRQSSGAGRRRMLCRLLRRLQPDLSSAAFIIVRLSTLFPPAVVPYCQPSPAAVLSITFATPGDGWLLRSPPTQQHTN